jgi:hypothetical protein
MALMLAGRPSPLVPARKYLLLAVHGLNHLPALLHWLLFGVAVVVVDAIKAVKVLAVAVAPAFKSFMSFLHYPPPFLSLLVQAALAPLAMPQEEMEAILALARY